MIAANSVGTLRDHLVQFFSYHCFQQFEEFKNNVLWRFTPDIFLETTTYHIIKPQIPDNVETNDPC